MRLLPLFLCLLFSVNIFAANTLQIGNNARVQSVSANYTALSSDDVILVDATAANRTVTLPSVSKGKMISVIKTDSGANTVTVTLINGSTVVLSNQYASVEAVSNGTSWLTKTSSISYAGMNTLLNTVLNNRVITSTNSLQIEAVTIDFSCTSSPCTMVRPTAGISSVTRGSAGSYVINFNAGVYSVAPHCVALAKFTGGAQWAATNNVPTTTTHIINVLNSAGALTDGGFVATCIGVH